MFWLYQELSLEHTRMQKRTPVFGLTFTKEMKQVEHISVRYPCSVRVSSIWHTITKGYRVLHHTKWK